MVSGPRKSRSARAAVPVSVAAAKAIAARPFTVIIIGSLSF
jgi:hypothetical protein